MLELTVDTVDDAREYFHFSWRRRIDENKVCPTPQPPWTNSLLSWWFFLAASKIRSVFWAFWRIAGDGSRELCNGMRESETKFQPLATGSLLVTPPAIFLISLSLAVHIFHIERIYFVRSHFFSPPALRLDYFPWKRVSPQALEA